MDLQTLLIEGIGFLETLPESAENAERLANWKAHLEQVNTTSTDPVQPPTGPKP